MSEKIFILIIKISMFPKWVCIFLRLKELIMKLENKPEKISMFFTCVLNIKKYLINRITIILNASSKFYSRIATKTMFTMPKK